MTNMQAELIEGKQPFVASAEFITCTDSINRHTNFVFKKKKPFLPIGELKLTTSKTA